MVLCEFGTRDSYPNIMGLSSEKAIELLAENNLKGEVIGISFSKEPSGTVISQRPEAGRTVKRAGQ